MEYLPYILITIGVITSILILTKINNRIKIFEKNITTFLKQEQTTNSNLTYALSRIEKKSYHFELIINSQKFLIFLLEVPNFSEIIVNNKTTWELRYGAGMTPGKSQPYHYYIPEIKPFMNLETTDRKVVVISPRAKKIAKYVNECEMVFVNEDTDVYGINIINDTNLSFFVKAN